jgi:hypothetical protein
MCIPWGTHCSDSVTESVDSSVYVKSRIMNLAYIDVLIFCYLVITCAQGAIFCVVEYDISVLEKDSLARKAAQSEGFDIDDLSMLPYAARSEHAIMKVSALNDKSKTSDFTREIDFQALLPDIREIDCNDPRNDHLLFLKSKKSNAGNEELFRLNGHHFSVFFQMEGGYFVNFAKFKENLRIKLLQMRSTKPYMFTDPIPLSEAVIKSSDVR